MNHKNTGAQQRLNPEDRERLVEALIAGRTCLAIMGPTASGKSQLSMALSEILPIEIISVDSALIYRQMDIGTAKPTAEEMQRVPHHLINTHYPDESYSASEFVQDVHRLVKEIFARGRLPVLVGGTMMYFNALQQGLNDLPSADEAVREKLQQAWQESPQALHKRLSEIDPQSAQRIHPNDPQRLIRALEVFEISGKPLSEHRKNQKTALQDFSLVKVGLLTDDRKALHKQIEKRFRQMLEAGFLAEVKALYSQPGLKADMNAIRSVGYRQAWQYLDGEWDYDTFVEKGMTATRQLAKRQFTWLRKEQELVVLDPFKSSLSERVAKTLEVLERSAEEIEQQGL